MSLSLKNIKKHFGEKNIFSSLTYDFEDCGIFAITGESGIGKTTLLRIIAGLDNDYDGEVINGGIGNVSFAFQEYRLFSHLSALENVTIAVPDRKDEAVFQKAANLLQILGFKENDINLYPSELSGGMKQRVSLARAFLYDAPILLLDEPTKELDDDNARIVRELIAQEAEKRLVILVSHDLNDREALRCNIIDLACYV